MTTLDTNGCVHDGHGRFAGHTRTEGSTSVLDRAPGFARRFPPTEQELVATIGFPMDVVSATLDRGLDDDGPGTNVAFAYDHWEAAAFLRTDWDEVVRDWHGTEQQLAFLTAFVDHFGPDGSIPNPY